MKLDHPTPEYTSSSTPNAQHSAMINTANEQLSEIAKTTLANIRVIALKMMKHIVMPFCMEYDYEFLVKPERGTFTLTPQSDKAAPKEQLDYVLAVINQDTCLALAPKLFMLMPSFSLHYKGVATTTDGEQVNVVGFRRFTEHKCPYDWLGGYDIEYGNSAWTGTLRPDELTFN
ncbi:hypothetical protein OTK49_28475 [Vibrio coralliirubri]|uniref:hypothetical protein n=1 Tax=Vibrio coralliirubri TaxID=1516159 RepID=UPI002284838D|nr:hypothetical protein [Vibrio coralliirubri]MCY9866480.1 hypothetical protein [Vibrio coralliirubri]